MTTLQSSLNRHACEFFRMDINIGFCCPAAGLDLVALSESDSSLGDATDSDAASVTSDDVPSRMPAWAYALMDQVPFTPTVHHLVTAPPSSPCTVCGCAVARSAALMACGPLHMHCVKLIGPSRFSADPL